MVILICFLLICSSIIGFCLGSLYTMKTSTKSALDGWKQTLSHWEDNITFWKEVSVKLVGEIEELEKKLYKK